MPEMHFRIQWPDGSLEDAYSPSSVIAEHLRAGEYYSVPDFLERARLALHLASERVRAKYGFSCSAALDQLASIEARTEQLTPAERCGLVRVVSVAYHDPKVSSP